MGRTPLSPIYRKAVNKFEIQTLVLDMSIPKSILIAIPNAHSKSKELPWGVIASMTAFPCLLPEEVPRLVL